MALCVTASAWGADYNERASGDLSDDQNSPTVIGMDPGANVISGQVSDSPLDRDFFTLQVPVGTRIMAIELSDFELITTRSDGGMLVALEAGERISDLNSADALRGLVIAGVASGTRQGDDLLDDLGGGTLGPGAWTFWVQNTGSVTRYALTVQLEAEPAPPMALPPQNVPVLGPAGLLLLVSGLLLLARRALRS